MERQFDRLESTEDFHPRLEIDVPGPSGLGPTAEDIEKLHAMIDVLRMRDPEGLWGTVRFGTYRPEILLTFLRSEFGVADRIETFVHELVHAGSGPMSPFMRTAYFAGRVEQTGYNTVRSCSFLIDNECVGLVLPNRYFPRSEVPAYIPTGKRGGMETAYLTGSSGTQDFLTLLDELNAYTRGLRNNPALYDMQPEGKHLSHRLEKIILFIELYLKHARTKVPDVDRELQDNGEICLIKNKLVYNAEQAIAELVARAPDMTSELYDRASMTHYHEVD